MGGKLSDDLREIAISLYVLTLTCLRQNIRRAAASLSQAWKAQGSRRRLERSLGEIFEVPPAGVGAPGRVSARIRYWSTRVMRPEFGSTWTRRPPTMAVPIPPHCCVTGVLRGTTCPGETEPA